MTDEAPDSIIDLMLFAAAAVVIVGATLVGCRAVDLALSRKENKEEIER